MAAPSGSHIYYIDIGLSVDLRQRELKLQAADLAVVDLDSTTMEQDSILHDRESEACATELA